MLVPYVRRNVSVFDPFRDFNRYEVAYYSSDSSERTAFSADIKEDGDNYILEADLPGVKKEDIKLEVNDNVLTITAERHSDYEENDKKHNYIRCERSYGSFERSFDTTGIDTDNIDAEFNDGVLKLTMPKVPEVKPETKTLEIR